MSWLAGGRREPPRAGRPWVGQGHARTQSYLRRRGHSHVKWPVCVCARVCVRGRGGERLAEQSSGGAAMQCGCHCVSPCKRTRRFPWRPFTATVTASDTTRGAVYCLTEQPKQTKTPESKKNKNKNKHFFHVRDERENREATSPKLDGRQAGTGRGTVVAVEGPRRAARR